MRSQTYITLPLPPACDISIPSQGPPILTAANLTLDAPLTGREKPCLHLPTEHLLELALKATAAVERAMPHSLDLDSSPSLASYSPWEPRQVPPFSGPV